MRSYLESLPGLLGYTCIKLSRQNMKQITQIQWIKLVSLLVIFLLVSFGLAFLIQNLLYRLNLSISQFGLLAYLIIFLIAIVVNLSFIPLPFVISIMIAAASSLNPVLVALCGSLGACIGELSAYYVGFIGKKIAIPDDLPGYKRMQSWISRYGVWAIAFISFQPILLIELGGFIAGAAKMPLLKFFLGLWLGKFPKYLILIFTGLGVLKFIPFHL
jgi:membrane protein YqaA with SNARE-associated domain